MFNSKFRTLENRTLVMGSRIIKSNFSEIYMSVIVCKVVSYLLFEVLLCLVVAVSIVH